MQLADVHRPAAPSLPAAAASSAVRNLEEATDHT
jgi:hypothetical protein